MRGVVETWHGQPLRVQPSPRAAETVSPSAGRWITPTDGSPRTSTPTRTPQSGTPWTKLFVPSIGSRIQRYFASPEPLEVVLEQTAISDAPILVRCRAEGLLEASGISLVERYRCAISNRLEVPLFARTLRSPSFKPVTPGMFAPQRREAPGGVQPG